MKITTILAAAAFLAAPVAVSATSLVDGSFEIKGAASSVTAYCYDGINTPGGPACAPGAWSGTGIIASGNGAWGGTTTPAGSYYAFVQGQGTLSQTFTADGNGVGTVSWLDTNRSNTGGLQSYDVSIFDGTSTVSLGSFTSAVGSFTARTSSSFALVSGTQYTLSFTGLSAEDRTSFIDDVALSVAAVPEPSTWAMLIIGFGMVGAAARRRKAAVAA